MNVRRMPPWLGPLAALVVTWTLLAFEAALDAVRKATATAQSRTSRAGAA